MSEHDKQIRRGIYLLPNLMTTIGLFAGFYSIVAAMKGNFDYSAKAIFVAMIADGLDGRLARLTNTQSNFGMEYDSLADIVSFGVAPALMMYSWSLAPLGKFGWLASFLFTATGALRLARFNTQAASNDKNYFQGLPIPAGAGVLASLVWIASEYTWSTSTWPIFIALLTIAIGLLMVSNIRYYSFKKIDFKGKVPFVTVLVVLLGLIALASDPATVLFAVFLLYTISGPCFTLWLIRQKRKSRKYHT